MSNLETAMLAPTTAPRTDETLEPLAPAAGLILGLGLSAAMWLCIGVAVWLLRGV